MYLTETQTIIMILAVAAGTIVTRFLPFVLFPENKEVPAYIVYLGKALPPAMMGLLVVYCLKGVHVLNSPFGIPELLAIISIIFLHKWKSNALLSIGGGTAIYMILVQMVFV
jgi:branched-subunit amino acid transport protein AzlD